MTSGSRCVCGGRGFPSSCTLSLSPSSCLSLFLPRSSSRNFRSHCKSMTRLPTPQLSDTAAVNASLAASCDQVKEALQATSQRLAASEGRNESLMHAASYLKVLERVFESTYGAGVAPLVQKLVSIRLASTPQPSSSLHFPFLPHTLPREELKQRGLFVHRVPSWTSRLVKMLKLPARWRGSTLHCRNGMKRFSPHVFQLGRKGMRDGYGNRGAELYGMRQEKASDRRRVIED